MTLSLEYYNAVNDAGKLIALDPPKGTTAAYTLELLVFFIEDYEEQYFQLKGLR